jgi:hypothetical protein
MVNNIEGERAAGSVNTPDPSSTIMRRVSTRFPGSRFTRFPGSRLSGHKWKVEMFWLANTSQIRAGSGERKFSVILKDGRIFRNSTSG